MKSFKEYHHEQPAGKTANFFSYAKSLEKRERNKLREKILLATCIKNPTWYYWLNSERVGKTSQVIIEALLEAPRHILFPTEY